MRISVKDNLKQVTKGMTRLERSQVPFVTAKTLTNLAQKLAKPSKRGIGAVGKETGRVFKKKSGKPGATAFTKKNWFWKRATKTHLESEVFWDQSNADFMKFMVQGGARFPRNRAILVATKNSKSRLDSFGNFKKDAITELLADKTKFFAGTPKGARVKPAEGIWERYGRRTKRGGQKIRMVAAYAKRATYRPIFAFGTFARGYVFSRDDGFAALFNKNMKHALKSARPLR